MQQQVRALRWNNFAELHIRYLRLLRVSWHPRDVHRFLFIINRAENELPKPCYRPIASWNVVLATMKCLDAPGCWNPPKNACRRLCAPWELVAASFHPDKM